MELSEFRKLLHEVIEEDFSPKPIELSPRWAGGSLILKPSNDTQAKEIPLEVFWKKLMGIRDSLRVLEQKINSHKDLSQEDKVNFAAYITKSYGSMTTFNILFKDDKHKFVGTGGEGSGSNKSKEPTMTMAEAKRRLGLNEYE